MERRGVNATAPPRTIPQWIASPWFYLGFSFVIGIIVAQAVTGQLAPRWIKAMLGAAFLLALIRFPLYSIVCLFVIAFPFPTVVFVGNTNIIFVVFMLVVWGVKVRLGKEPASPKTYLDYACWLYIGVHLLSFINVETAEDFRKGISQVEFLAAAVGFYFLISKVLRTEQHLRIALYSLTVTSLLVNITGVMEYFIPAVRLIPDWFIDAGPTGRRFQEGGRVGGVFGFHGLLADFCGMVFIVQLYLFLRSKHGLIKAFLLSQMAAGVFLIFITANRGGLVIWLVGLLYFLWLGGGGLTLRRLIIVFPILGLLAVGIALLANEYGANVTIFLRLVGTQMERGAPDTRTEVWAAVLKEIPNHLWIGHGPYYNLLGGIRQMGRAWPHSAYLMYLWTTGVVGLSIFMWILIKTMVKSFPGRKLMIGEIPFAHGALVASHVMVVQFAMAQIRDEHQRGNVYVYIMWLVFGLAVASRRIWEEGEKARSRSEGSLRPG